MRKKIFGPAPSYSLDRNGKAVLMFRARALVRARTLGRPTDREAVRFGHLALDPDQA
jgi:hypothetical protein